MKGVGEHLAIQNFSVIVFGPPLRKTNNGYGGGQGGIVSAIARLTEYFGKHQVEYRYSEYSVRSYSKYWYLKLPYRLVRDLITFGKVCFQADKQTIAHVVADGGLATYRTLLAILIGRVYGLKIVTDVRGNGLGAFAVGLESLVGRVAWNLIIYYSQFVLVQRQSTIESLSGRYGSKLVLHPNWIVFDKAYERNRSILVDERIKIGFVGYCFADKGVYEIVEGCELAAKQIAGLELHFIGAESTDFASYLDSTQDARPFPIMRHGRVSQPEARLLMKSLDVFVFPTSFKSEGHPNVINEAMFARLAIVTSEVGAIGEVLTESMAYFIPPRSANSIAERLVEINLDRDSAREKADKAFEKVTTDYEEHRVLGSLMAIYAEAAQANGSR